MDIYLTNLDTNERIRFPMLPEKIQAQIGNEFYDYSIMTIGEIKLPSGLSLDGFSWNGMFPGKSRANEPYVRAWRDPQGLYKWIEGLKPQRTNMKKLRLLITETPINCDVYLRTFNGELSGGYGDINYQINFIQAKDLKIHLSTKTIPVQTAATTTNAPKQEQEITILRNTYTYNDDGLELMKPAPLEDKPEQERPSPPPAKTHTIVSGDTLWGIAQKYYGNGSQYAKIYDANKDVIESEAKCRGKQGSNNGHWIYPGTVLTIP